jgi:hypothetical protein
MVEDLRWIFSFIGENFLHILPYMVISVPLAVVVRLSNMSRYVEQVLRRHPWQAIALATIVGAFSPLCSCSVIPVIASLLIAGVPLPPVMAFWIASPSMDPEIFALSVGLLGWELATVRVAATLILSVTAGGLAWGLTHVGYFDGGVIRTKGSTLQQASWKAIWQAWRSRRQTPALQPALASLGGPTPLMMAGDFVALSDIGLPDMPATVDRITLVSGTDQTASASDCACDNGGDAEAACAIPSVKTSQWVQWGKIRHETLAVSWMLVQMMTLAFLLEALILLYVPQATIVNFLGSDNPFSVALAALAGIPIYTTNLTAMPLMAGLLEQGMAKGAVLAFLLAGPTTTLPAMAAVYGVATRRVFMVYLGIAFFGAITLGYLYQGLIWTGLF